MSCTENGLPVGTKVREVLTAKLRAMTGEGDDQSLPSTANPTMIKLQTVGQQLSIIVKYDFSRVVRPQFVRNQLLYVKDCV